MEQSTRQREVLVAVVNRVDQVCLIEKAQSEQRLEVNEGFSQEVTLRQRQKLNLGGLRWDCA